MSIVSNLTRIIRFLDWVLHLPRGTDLGREILSRASDLDFLPFFVNQPVLEEFFARISVENRSKPIEGFIVAMTVDPENNLFSVQISDQLLSKLIDLDIPLDKLKSFEQLSTSESIERHKSTINLRSRILSAQNQTPPIRRSECNPSPTSHDRQL